MSSAKPSLNDLRIDRGPEQARSSGAPWLRYVVIILVLAAGAAFFWKGRTQTVEVQTIPARQTSGGAADRTVLNATGYVTARRKATVSAMTTGKVIDVLIAEGMKV